jgi:hypothetical protein
MIKETSSKNILTQYNKFFNYLGLVFYAFIIYKYFQLWAFPSLEDASSIVVYNTLMGFEFILILTSLFLAISWGTKSMYIILILYTLFFIWGFRTSTPESILYAYLYVVFNRTRVFFMQKPSDQVEKKGTIIYYLFNILVYTVLVLTISVISAKIAVIPRLGLTDHYIAESGYYSFIIGDGNALMSKKPHVGLFIGCIYFIILASIEFWKINRPEQYLAFQKSFGKNVNQNRYKF